MLDDYLRRRFLSANPVISLLMSCGDEALAAFITQRYFASPPTRISLRRFRPSLEDKGSIMYGTQRLA